MKYLCEKCNYETPTKFLFDQHLKTKKHQEKIKENEQLEDTNENKSPLNEIVKIGNKYKCNHCGYLFKNLELIEIHIKRDCKYDIRYNNFYIFEDDKLGANIFENTPNAGDVYIVQTDFSNNNVFKIGITRGLKNRIKEYRTGCNYEPKLYYYFPCKDIIKADQQIKYALKEFNIKREIFQGDIELIKKNIRDYKDIK